MRAENVPGAHRCLVDTTGDSVMATAASPGSRKREFASVRKAVTCESARCAETLAARPQTFLSILTLHL